MLSSADALNSQLLALGPVITSQAGAEQFIGVVSAFINQVQAGPTGTPGILTYANAPAIAAVASLAGYSNDGWISGFANAIHIGVTSGTLSPGTVISPAWAGGSTTDVLPPTITTLSAALSTLTQDLKPVVSNNDPALPLAQAIRNYALAFTFLCTGITASGPPPLSLPFGAE